LAQPTNVSQGRANPLKKVSKELFAHAQEHISRNLPFDRLVAGVHVDNALELFLKFYGVMNNIPGYERKMVPELTKVLEQYVPELVQFGGDLRTFHNIRDGAYHLGQPLDEYNLNWGIETIESFMKQVEQREKQRTSSLPDGGTPYSSSKKSQAERELETAVSLFGQLPPGPTKEQTETVLAHLLKAFEYWLEGGLSSRFREQEISEMSMSEKLDMIKKEISDQVLLDDLRQINNLRNAVMHGRDVRPDQISRRLQTLMHLVKLKSPSEYRTRPSIPLNQTLTGVLVRSKSEVIIANIFTYLGIKYDYEKILRSKIDPDDVRRPDFTITLNGEQFYWEHLSMIGNREYRSAWEKTKKWYEENGYADRLIVSADNPKGNISSEAIVKLAKEQILDRGCMPKDLSPRQYYARIYAWHKTNRNRIFDKLSNRRIDDPYVLCYEELVEVLPRPETATMEDIAFVCREVLSGLMEWAYHERDERGIETAAYAQHILEEFFDGFNGTKAIQSCRSSQLYARNNMSACMERHKSQNKRRT
jgi:hypothetical protein